MGKGIFEKTIPNSLVDLQFGWLDFVKKEREAFVFLTTCNKASFFSSHSQDISTMFLEQLVIFVSKGRDNRCLGNC